jgi:hypothetical protein
MTTANLLMGELAESQSSKSVTINEALHVLDALVQCAIIDRDLATPPGSPVNGNVYIVAGSPTGAWVGHTNHLAQWDVTAWRFHVPEEGWMCYVRDEDALLVYTGSAWTVLAGSGAGGVTSVALTVPAELSVAGSPITASGTLAVTKANQSANQVWAGPTTGSPAAPAFRALVAADIPASPYDVGSFCEAAPTASQVVLRHVFARSVVFAAGLSPSRGVAGTAATASTTFTIKKNGSSVGSFNFATSATTATFTMASPTTFAAGDVMTVEAPGTPDATLAQITFTLSGTR